MYLDLCNQDISNTCFPVSQEKRMILSLSAFTNSPLQGHTAIPLVVTSGDQEELAIWTEGYVQGDKAHKIISKFIHVYSPALQGGRGGEESN